MNRPIRLPFPGFYYSTLSDALDGVEEPYVDALRIDEFSDVSSTDLDDATYWATNYTRAHATIAKAWVEALIEQVNAELDTPLALAYESMDSPKEYNFTTDRVYAVADTATIARMRAAVPDTTLAGVLEELFMARSGFIPFYSTQVSVWNAKPLETWDHNELYALFLAFLRPHGIALDALLVNVLETLEDRGVFSSAFYAALDLNELRARLTQGGAP